MRKRLTLSLFSLLMVPDIWAANYAVTPDYFDDIGGVIGPLGFTYDTIQEESLADLSTLRNYRAVFVNCSGSISTNFTEEAAAAVRQYVAEGGVIYASDWAFVVVAGAFPGYVSYYPSPRTAPAQEATVSIENTSMQDFMGVSNLDINFNLGGWVPMADVNSKYVDVYLRGTSGDEYVNGKPVLVKFDYGEGAVIYTSFHNEAGLSSEAGRALEYMVLISVLTTAANRLASYLRSLGYIVTKENLDLEDAGVAQSFSYTHSASNEQDLVFAANWLDPATMTIQVTGPSGSFSPVSSSVPGPFYLESLSSPNGSYTYSITPSGTASPTAFVAMAAKKIAAYDSVNSVKAYPNPFRADEHTVVVFEGLTAEATVEIYSMSGRLVKTISKNDSSGTAFWELTDDGGAPVPSGLYLFRARGTSGSIQKGKVAVIR